MSQLHRMTGHTEPVGNTHKILSKYCKSDVYLLGWFIELPLPIVGKYLVMKLFAGLRQVLALCSKVTRTVDFNEVFCLSSSQRNSNAGLSRRYRFLNSVSLISAGLTSFLRLLLLVISLESKKKS